jgi:hypothetical protein
MRYSSFPSERLVLTAPRDPRLRRKATAWDRIVVVLTDPELIALAMFCALGLAVTIGACVLIPGFGAIATSLHAPL